MKIKITWIAGLSNEIFGEKILDTDDKEFTSVNEWIADAISGYKSGDDDWGTFGEDNDRISIEKIYE